MTVRKSSVAIFLTFSAMAGFFLMTSEPTIGFTTWEEFVVIFLVCGLVLAKVMFKEKKPKEEKGSTTPGVNTISNIEGDRKGPSKVQEPIGPQVSPPYERGRVMDSLDMVERLVAMASGMTKKNLDDSIEATRKLQENSIVVAEKAAAANPDKWDGGELAGSTPGGVSFRFVKGTKIEGSTGGESNRSLEEDPDSLGRITEIPNQEAE